jgi:hypothetical protein
MDYIVIALLIVFSVSGIGLGIYSFHNLRPIFDGLWTSWQKWLTTAVFSGLSFSMIFMSIILVMGLIDSKYIWSLKKILNSALFSLIFGFIVTLGALWQFFIVNWYRKKVIKKLGHNNEK